MWTENSANKDNNSELKLYGKGQVKTTNVTNNKKQFEASGKKITQ